MWSYKIIRSILRLDLRVTAAIKAMCIAAIFDDIIVIIYAYIHRGNA